MICWLQETMIIYNRLQGAADAEARLLLASNVTVPSSGFVFHKRITEYPWCNITSALPGHNNKPWGLLPIAKSDDNNVTLYNNQLFLLSTLLKDALKNFVVLLTIESSSNIIQ